MKYWTVIFGLLIAANLFAAEYRIWQGRQGKRMKATFAGFKDSDHVLLRKENGDLRKVPIANLCDADQAHLKKLRAQQANKPAKSPSTTVGKPQTVVSFSEISQTPGWMWGIIGAVALAINIPLAIGIGRWLFGDFGGFMEALRFWFQPDWISMFRGEWRADWAAEFKLGFYLFLMIAIVVVEIIVVLKYVL